ncbi:MAG TPA: cation:proton antiporter family protein [Acidiferrobacterales bacterium]
MNRSNDLTTMPAFSSVFYEITALLLVAAAVGALALKLRQPLIVAFIAVGIAVGPAGLGWVASRDQVDLLAALGIALLLFVVGLKLDLHLIRSLGPVALATGLGQVAFTSIIGYLIALALGLDHIPAVYVAVALTFSSTIIIVKLLSDKREIDALHGRIAVGFLIVQDVVVIVAMIVLSAFGVATGEAASRLWVDIGLVVVKGVGMLAGLGLVMRYLLPPLLRGLARSPELLVLFAVAWAVALASLGDYLGLSKEVGAFLAGVSIASTPYREAISTRLVTLRDFLLLFFFVSLGAQLDLRLLGDQLWPSVVLSLFVLIGNPLIVMVIMGAMGYRKRTGFLAGLTVAQISEFSLVFAALGLSLGHIDPDTLGLITLVGLVTIGLSTYLILYSHPIYDWIAPWLGVFERHVPHREQAFENAARPDTPVDVILFGLGRFGDGIARALRSQGVSVLGVDFDPQASAAWRREGLAAVYGDAEDPEFTATLPLARARWVVCAIPQREANLALQHALRAHAYGGKVALTAHSADDARLFEAAGADLVLRPFAAAAERTADTLLASLRPAAQRDG